MAIIAYKAFRRGLIATHGRGQYQYKEGINEFKAANCAREGAHCAEDPLDMFNYYTPGPDTEYRIVIASGDIDEDGADSKIACTRLIVKQELSIEQVAAAALIFWKNHPDRSRKEYDLKKYFRMARGKHPYLKGQIGEWLCYAIGTTKTISRIGMIYIDGVNHMPNTLYDIDGQKKE